MTEAGKEKLVIGNADEAAQFLIREFLNLDEHNEEMLGEGEDDANSFIFAQQEKILRDFWKNDIDPLIKVEAIKKLLEMNRKDVVIKIDRLSDISEFVDAETLKQIREDKE